MFEKFTSSESNDFRQRYMGTYGFFTRKGNRTLTKLTSITADGSASTVEFEDKDKLKYLLKADSKEEGLGFEFLPPKSAYYNTTDGVPLLVTRIPARQYLRGLCDKNTEIRNFSGNIGISFDSLGKIFGVDVPIMQAMAAMKKAIKASDLNAGIAVSPQFVVSPIHKFIRCFNQTIGVCSLGEDDVFTVELDSPELWQQDITDAFRRANLKVVFK